MLQKRLQLLFPNGFVRKSNTQMHQAERNGVVFTVKTKQHFEQHGVKGNIVHSFAQLEKSAPHCTHFTPNVFRIGAFNNVTETISGFTEHNLQQINTFVVDIDTHKYTPQEILLTCMDQSIGAPTWIVKTPRGYQVYFVLAQPFYISNAKEFRTLAIAKRIAHNLKRSLQDVQADLYCNDFGFFRVPSNVVWEQHTYTYTIDELIHWSMRFDDAENVLFTSPNKQGGALMNTPWCQALLQSQNVRGKKGQIGRNNMLFTLALVCFHDGWCKSETKPFIKCFNQRFYAPLKDNEVNTIVESAFSGRYSGPAAQYVEALLELYAPEHAQRVCLHSTWYKFKKSRDERVRSHNDEWEQDLIDYITAQKDENAPFLWATQKQICDAIGIPSSTLNDLIKKSTNLVLTRIGKGRGAKTGWTTVALYKQFLINAAIERAKAHTHYYTALHYTFEYYAPLEKNNGYIALQQQLFGNPTVTYEKYSNVP